MRLDQTAAQLYTIRDHIQTASEFAVSMRRLKEIGFTAVQVSALGPIDDREVVRVLDGEGLGCCAIHASGAELFDEPGRVAERLDALRCSHVAFPHPGDAPLQTVADVQALAARLDAAGAILRTAGKTLSYHNHSLEFRRISGRTILDWIFDSADPAHLQGEIDTYWVQHGGGDPVEWCHRMTGRLPVLHIKDYAIGDDNQPRFAEIGNGNLSWERIVAAADEAGCQWYVIEQDTCPGDPFDSLKISYDYVKSTLCAGARS